MRTTSIVFIGAAAIALLAGGCSEKVSPAPPASAPSPAASANPAPVTKPAAAPATKAPVKPTTRPAGHDADWIGALAGCPNDGQKTEVQKLVYGDVTGDGVPDALVARTCEAATSYWPTTVEVFDGASGANPRRVGTLLTDVGDKDLPWFRSMSVSGQTVTIKAYGTSPRAERACADLELTYRYDYRGGEFTRTGRQATRSAECLPIQ